MGAKKHGIMVKTMSDEFRKMLRAIEVEEKGLVVLGDTGGPPLDLYETKEHIVIEADLPGIEPDDVEVSFSRSVLTIEGMKREKVNEPERVNYLCMERSFEAFRRFIRITAPVNPNGMTAVYARGVLTIKVPKVEEKRGKVVRVRVDRG